ncbi:MAG TPA: alpha/beta hydrolase [Amycolatopsis sp.]|nr:alpha/beta hydrolase [Amycolatopsis sp.]
MSARSARRFVTGDGTGLFVRSSGPEEAPVTLVLLHAWTQDHTEWDPVVPLVPAGLRVLRYDHRGHGASDPARPGTATVARLADDLAELVTELAPAGRLVLAGHSLGGMTVMALAERYPELVSGRVAGVAFIATSCAGMDRLTFGLTGVAGRVAAGADQAFRRLLARDGRRSVPFPSVVVRPVTRWLAFGDGAARAQVRAVTGQILRAHPGSVAGFRASISRHDRRAALAALRGTPTVILAGDRDRITPSAHARVIARELPDAEFVRYPGAGHELPYERAREVAHRLTGLAAPAGPVRGDGAGNRRRFHARPGSP